MTYGYDNANRLTSVTDWNSNAIAYAYDDAGRLTTKTLPSGTGIVSSYSYDTADRLTGISHVKGGSTTIASVSYTLDDVGNRTQRVDQQGTHTYAYDDVYRLTSVTYPGPATTSYTFDAFGNRTSMTVGSAQTTYAYDDADRLTTVTPPSPAPAVSYTWDDNGSLTARGSDSFAWDYEERMTSATVNSVTTTFAYRGDGLRNSRTTGGNTTTFTWDIAAGLPVVIDDGSQYVYGAGLEAMKQGGSWYYYLADGLGSTMAIVDASGTVQKSYTYDIYGKPTATGSLSNEFDFASQQTDPTGLQYLRARYMDPETGTFISRDPIARSPLWLANPYQYAAADPTSHNDPSGLAPLGGNECSVLKWCFIPIIPGMLILDPKLYGIDAVWEFSAMRLPFGAPTLYRACLVYSDGETSCETRTLRDWALYLTTVAGGGAAVPEKILPLLNEAGKIIGTVTFSGGRDRLGRPHWSRHLEDAGISRETAEGAIKADLESRIQSGTLQKGLNNIDITIEGKSVRYTAYVRDDDTINVGRAILP